MGGDEQPLHVKRERKNSRRHRLSPGQYAITVALVTREQKGLCWFCKKPGIEELHHTCHDPACQDPNHWRGAHSKCNKSEAGRHGWVDSVKMGEREKMGVIDFAEPASAEIEISMRLFPWYGKWLWRETSPEKPRLQKHRAIHGAVMEAKSTLGYGSEQTLRSYLRTWTNGMNAPFIERYDPTDAITKWIERRPGKSSLHDALQKQLHKLDRQRSTKALEDTGRDEDEKPTSDQKALSSAGSEEAGQENEGQ